MFFKKKKKTSTFKPKNKPLKLSKALTGCLMMKVSHAVSILLCVCMCVCARAHTQGGKYTLRDYKIYDKKLNRVNSDGGMRRAFCV